MCIYSVKDLSFDGRHAVTGLQMIRPNEKAGAMAACCCCSVLGEFGILHEFWFDRCHGGGSMDPRPGFKH